MNSRCRKIQLLAAVLIASSLSGVQAEDVVDNRTVYTLLGYKGDVEMTITESKNIKYLISRIIYNKDEKIGAPIPIDKNIPLLNGIKYTEDQLVKITLPPLYLEKALFKEWFELNARARVKE